MMYVSSLYYFVFVLQEELKNIFDNESKWWKMLLSILVFICQSKYLNSLFLALMRLNDVLLKHI